MKIPLFYLFTTLFISEVSYSQMITTVAGTGTAGFTADGIAATATQLNGPNTLAFDNAGNLFFCDNYNNRIRKINRSGVVTTVAGNGGINFSGDNGPATLAELYEPISIAIDINGNIFTSTTDHRIRKINAAGIISTVAGDGTSGYNGDNIPATDAQLFNPVVGDIDNQGNCIFADNGNHRVRKIDDFGIISTIVGNGTNAYSGDGLIATAASLKRPVWPSFSPTNELYIPDDVARCVRKVNSAGVISTFAGTGVAGNSGDGGPATAAKLNYPNGVAFDQFGNTFIADAGAHVIRKVDVAGIITTIAGTGTAGYGGDNGPASAAQLNAPNCIAVNASGNLFVADFYSNRIRKITFHPETAVNNVIGVSNEVSIHPNPAHTSVNIRSATPIETVSITNTIGQVVLTNTVASKKEVVLRIESLSAGVYHVGINGVYSGRFLKQ